MVIHQVDADYGGSRRPARCWLEPAVLGFWGGSAVATIAVRRSPRSGAGELGCRPDLRGYGQGPSATKAGPASHLNRQSPPSVRESRASALELVCSQGPADDSTGFTRHQQRYPHTGDVRLAATADSDTMTRTPKRGERRHPNRLTRPRKTKISGILYETDGHYEGTTPQACWGEQGGWHV
jgi:hypothetical protein